MCKNTTSVHADGISEDDHCAIVCNVGNERLCDKPNSKCDPHLLFSYFDNIRWNKIHYMNDANAVVDCLNMEILECWHECCLKNGTYQKAFSIFDYMWCYKNYDGYYKTLRDCTRGFIEHDKKAYLTCSLQNKCIKS